MFSASFMGQPKPKRRGLPICKRRLIRISEFKKMRTMCPVGSRQWKRELVQFLQLCNEDNAVELSDIERWAKNNPNILEYSRNDTASDTFPIPVFSADSLVGPSSPDSGQGDHHFQNASGQPVDVEPENYENFTLGPVIENVYSTAGSNHAGEQQQGNMTRSANTASQGSSVTAEASGVQFCQLTGLSTNQPEIPPRERFEVSEDLLKAFNKLAQANKEFRELRLPESEMRRIYRGLQVFQKKALLLADIPAKVKIEVIDLEASGDEEDCAILGG